MKKLGYASILTFIALAVSACNSVGIRDGRVPAEYLPKVQQTLAGTYAGQIEGRSIQFTVALEGDKPVVRGVTETDDFAGQGCASTVGNLKEVRFSGNGALRMATFGFDAALCSRQVEGRMITFWLKEKQGQISVVAQYLKENVDQFVCSDSARTDQIGCRWETIPVEVRGSFVKTN